MIIVEENLPDKNTSYSFLLHSKYNKFSFWPSITDQNVADFLFKELQKIQNTGKIFTAKQHNELIALIAFRKLEWDTQHFGFGCISIDYILSNRRSDNATIGLSLKVILAEFQKYCVDNSIKFVSVSIDSWDFNVGFALQKTNFRFILSWIDGFFNGSDRNYKIEDDHFVGLIKPEEIEYFQKLASSSHSKGGRFYSDPNFDKQLVSDMYAKLVESSFRNGDFMLVYRIKNRPVGLFVCKKIVTYGPFSNLRVAPLRYLIIDPEFRKKGIAYNLSIKTLEYLKNKSDLITTGLEVHNLPSLNLHSKVGFKFNYNHNVYHWWNNLESGLLFHK